MVAHLNGSYGCVAWNEPAQRVAIGLNNGSIAILDAASFARKLSQPISGNALLRLSSGGDLPVRSVAWNRAGTSLACGLDDGTLVLFDVERQGIAAKATMHSDGINSVSWSHDDHWIATASDDFAAKMTEVKTLRSSGNESGGANADDMRAVQKEPAILVTRFNEWVNAIAFAPAELSLATVSRDGQFQVWDFNRDGAQMVPELRFSRANARGSEIAAVVWSTDGEHLATSGESTEIQIWSAETGLSDRMLHGHTQPVHSLSWMNHTLVSSGDDGTVKLWNSNRSPEGQVISDTTTPARFVRWHPVLPLAAWRDVDGVVTVWDNEQRRIPTRFSESITSATALGWHPTKPLLALSREESVLIYDLEDDSTLIQLDHDPSDSVWHIRWSPDGTTLAISGAAGKLSLWSVHGEKLIRTVDELDSISAFCWSRDGKQVYAVNGNGTIHGINPDDGLVTQIRSIEKLSAKSIRVSPAGTQLAVTSEAGQIFILSLEDGELAKLRGHQGTTWTCVWTRDGRRLISGGQDGTIRIWHVASRQETLRLSKHDSAVWAVDVNDGNQVISASSDGTVRLWGDP